MWALACQPILPAGKNRFAPKQSLGASEGCGNQSCVERMRCVICKCNVAIIDSKLYIASHVVYIISERFQKDFIYSKKLTLLMC